MSKTRILLVDDHAVVRAGYRLLLSQTPGLEVAGEAERGEVACGIYSDLQPDVVVMDLSMPGIGGVATIARLRARDAHARILVFSVHDELVYVARALEAGAKGYISKSSAPDILVEAVRRIAVGQPYIEPEIAQRLALSKATGNDAMSVLNSLSAREFDIFCLLARGYTTREVAEELRLGLKTVSNYATLVKNKLSLSTSAEMARLAYQIGLIKH
ncbi:response regulator transcription factor [Methylococcus sp. EFPC2]|uniref:response regulator n=1 Tax=Methylococcus sp. EFPC2 TaxID=2812648 RepID=UPI0019673983|nr:response regulator transcription factor [Methylococcus sp. EFPC2]QSA97380.1 response regulator transcription factor [Methylococcus sp. EFPC2]